MTDQFNELLHSLGKLFGLPLHTDKHNACALQIAKGLVVQLQLDESMEKMLIASKVVEVPPGKFREDVLLEVLKANGFADPLIGIFAYIPHTNELVLFQQYPMDILTGERLAGLILPFMDLCKEWRAAILSGQHCPSPQQPTPPMGAIR
jgi:hypothetical protein